MPWNGYNISSVSRVLVQGYPWGPYICLKYTEEKSPYKLTFAYFLKTAWFILDPKPICKERLSLGILGEMTEWLKVADCKSVG